MYFVLICVNFANSNEREERLCDRTIIQMSILQHKKDFYL